MPGNRGRVATPALDHVGGASAITGLLMMSIHSSLVLGTRMPTGTTAASGAKSWSSASTSFRVSPLRLSAPTLTAALASTEMRNWCSEASARALTRWIWSKIASVSGIFFGLGLAHAPRLVPQTVQPLPNRLVARKALLREYPFSLTKRCTTSAWSAACDTAAQCAASGRPGGTVRPPRGGLAEAAGRALRGRSPVVFAAVGTLDTFAKFFLSLADHLAVPTQKGFPGTLPPATEKQDRSPP